MKLQDGNFQLQNVGSSRCLTAEKEGILIDQWECVGEAAAPHQTWRIFKSYEVNFEVWGEDSQNIDIKSEGNIKCKWFANLIKWI